MGILTNITKATLGKSHTGKQKIHKGKISWLNEKILKHQDDLTLKTFRTDRFTFHYKRPYEFLHTYQEIFGKEIYRFTSSSKKPYIIDCGSNIGLSVLYFKFLYPDAKILAFEPDRNNYELLKTNIEGNSLRDVEIRQAAVWVNNGKISFEASGSEASHIQERSEGNQIEAVRLHDVLSASTIVDFLKIDIEGAEWKVIPDSAPQLHKVQNLFLEYHGKVEEVNKLIDQLSIMKEAGFFVYIQNAADNLPSPYQNKTTGGLYDVQLNIYGYRT